MTDRLRELCEGWEAAAEAEAAVVAALEPYRLRFSEGDRQPETMRRLRVLNEARRNHDNFWRDAIALRWLLESTL